MKKRLLTVLALILIAALLSTVVVGCTFIRENNDRKVNETYATISNNGITLTVSYNEFMDYFNSMGYMYVQYYGYSVAEALDLTISNKIQQKYLMTLAMPYLANAAETSSQRNSVLYGKGVTAKPEDVLTYAERYAAIYAVNDSILSSVEDTAADLKQDDLKSKINAAKSTGVKEIRFTEATLDYFDTFFHLSSTPSGAYVGQELDFDKVQIEIVYDDDSTAGPFVVPESMYTTAFDSAASDSNSERTEEKEFVITFEETVTDENGEESTEDVTLTYEYTLVYPRETKEEPAEETEYDKVTIGEFDPVSRYATDAEVNGEIKNKSKKYASTEEMRSANASDDSFYEEAWRQIAENLSNAGKTLDYLYNSQFESAVLSALQAERYLKADAEF